jgi:asparagine synthase (glutamine-hydrolysing)
MCGIAGYVGSAGAARPDGAIAGAMADLIRHRGPDDDGTWADPEAGVALAQRRLAIIDLSAAGHQPMVSACGRYVIVVNGEIYNYPAIRATLEAEPGQRWRGHSDIEVLLAAIVRWGLKAALEQCVGMFALALWDRQRRSLALARDRLGEKPLYYGRIGKSFAFASDLAAFRAHPAWDPRIDRNAVALLMRHSCVPAPYSIYQGILKLRPGTILTLEGDAGEPRLEPYWSAREAAERGRARPFGGSRDDAVDALEALLRQAVAGQMIADVPVGAFLSGGIDSSTIVALMQSSGRQARTFTIGFERPDYDEAGHARVVARHLGTDHTELTLTEREAMEVVPGLAGIYAEPFSDASQIPTCLVARLARRSVTVALSGDGGDELFSGYTRYALADTFWRRLGRVPAPLRRAAAGLLRLPSPAAYDRLAQPLLSLLPDRRRPARLGEQLHKAAELLPLGTMDEVYRRLGSHWVDPAALVPGSTEPPTMLTGLEPLPALGDSVERMMYLDLTSYLPDDILVKVDRAAMAVGLETRVPLLDHRVVELALSLPLSIRRADGSAKWPLRQLLHRHVPPALVDRRKRGFAAPIDAWLRGPLRDWAEELLAERRLAAEGFFAPAPIRLAWREHLVGRSNNQYPLWDVLMFQAWHAERQRGAAALAA